MTKVENITVQILREIRDAAFATNGKLDETNRRLASVEAAVGETNERLSVVETTLLELAEQQRFVVRGLRATSGRGRRVEADVADLRVRVERLEKRQA